MMAAEHILVIWLPVHTVAALLLYHRAQGLLVPDCRVEKPFKPDSTRAALV